MRDKPEGVEDAAGFRPQHGATSVGGVISDLVLGAMYFGTRTDRDTSFALLDRFVAAGGTTIDTANCYAFWADASGHGGQSETTIGEWLWLNPGIRDRLTLSTKVGVEPLDSGGLEGLAPDVVRREAHRSRDRLGVETLDVYWAHGEDRSTAIGETVEAMGTLVTAGVVRRLGLSNHPTWLLERARAHAQAEGLEPVTAVQLSTSYIEPRPGAAVEGKDHRFGWVSEETLDYATVHPEVEIWAYSPLIGGAYDRGDRPIPRAYQHSGTSDRLAALADVAARRGLSRSQVVLAWLLHRQPRIRPIAGVSTVEQLEAALEAGEVELDADELAQLDAPA